MSKKVTMKVWVIEEGEYSDYRVVGVFSSKENADLVAAAINAHAYGVSVAEWDMDPAVDEIRRGLLRFLVTMRRDGTVERCEQKEMSEYEIGTTSTIWRRSTAPAYVGKGVEDALNACMWAKDQKHAIKIANEQRVQFIASGEWDGIIKENADCPPSRKDT